jgi:hypothetical protein
MDERLIEIWLHNVNGAVNDLRGEVTELRRFQSTVEYDKQVQTALEVMNRMQAGHASYTNLVIAAGYAAFFAFWSTLKNELPSWLYAISGLFIILSLIIFIVWELMKMVWSAIAFRRIEARLASHTPDADIMIKWQQELTSFDRRIGKLWIWFLIPTVVFGLTSALCLVAFFVWRLSIAFAH